jgi:hypothetical protein
VFIIVNNPLRLILLTVLSLALLESRYAQAGPLAVDFTATPASIDLLEGESGKSIITLSHSMAVNFDVGFGGVTNPLAIFGMGDREDFVTKERITGGTCKQGGILIALGPGGSCTFEVSFDTGDLRNPDPDKDFGLWTVTMPVSFFQVGNPGNTDGLNPNFQVRVFDPGAPGAPAPRAPIPEPSTALLLDVGLAVFALTNRSKKPQ